MGTHVDLDHAGPWRQRARPRPGPVRDLRAELCFTPGELRLHWQPPAGSGPDVRYRIERTRQGRVFQVLTETVRLEYFVRPAPEAPWFYRVTALNEKGAGRAKLVIFYRRASGQCRTILQTIPVLPGVRVSISELG